MKRIQKRKKDIETITEEYLDEAYFPDNTKLVETIDRHFTKLSEEFDHLNICFENNDVSDPSVKNQNYEKTHLLAYQRVLDNISQDLNSEGFEGFEDNLYSLAKEKSTEILEKVMENLEDLRGFLESN